MHIQSSTAYGEAARGIDDPLALCNLFVAFIRRFGADGLAYAMLTPPARPDPLRTVGQLPGGWIDRYYRQGYAAIDPQLPIVRSCSRPFLWSRTFARRGRAGGRAARQSARFLKEAAAFGLRDAITFTIPCQTGPDAALVVTSVDRDSLAAAFDEMLQPLHVAVLEFHLMIRPLLDRRPACQGLRLTGRERQCYQWIARGKSSWEIGQILGISERTAVFHIDNVKRKLGVGSRIQAMVKLMLAGEIEP